jgi:PASTA domain
MSTVRTDAKPIVRKKVKDAQTGKDFDVIDEGRIDIVFAWISAAYSIAVIGFLTWVVLSMLYGGLTAGRLATWLMPVLNLPASKLIFYTAIGGAIGASVNNLRSFIAWHAEERAFGWRFIWKYLAMPPIGATLAVLVYGILQSGAAVITGASAPTEGQPTSAVSALTAWATGTLAGYGSHNVFKWLDDKVNTLFKVDAQQTTTVPDVKGKSLEEAKQMVIDARLKVGDITKTPASSDQADMVIAQTHEAGTTVNCDSKVDLTVGIAGPTDPAPNPPEEDTIPHNGQPNLVDEPVEANAGDETKV